MEDARDGKGDVGRVQDVYGTREGEWGERDAVGVWVACEEMVGGGEDEGKGVGAVLCCAGRREGRHGGRRERGELPVARVTR